MEKVENVETPVVEAPVVDVSKEEAPAQDSVEEVVKDLGGLKIENNEQAPVQSQQPAPSSGDKMTGTCKWFNPKKGFGFITPTGGGDDVFVHQTNIHSEGFRSLAEGEPVEFVLVDNNGRQQAASVTGPNGSYCKGQPRRTYNRDNNNQGGMRNGNRQNGNRGDPNMMYQQGYNNRGGYQQGSYQQRGSYQNGQMYASNGYRTMGYGQQYPQQQFYQGYPQQQFSPVNGQQQNGYMQGNGVPQMYAQQQQQQQGQQNQQNQMPQQGNQQPQSNQQAQPTGGVVQGSY